MRTFAFAAAMSTGLVAVALGSAAPGSAMPSDLASAEDTVNRLQNEGLRVILNKVGTGSLQQCTTTAIRPGRDVTEPATSRVGGRDPVVNVRYTTVHVDVQC